MRKLAVLAIAAAMFAGTAVPAQAAVSVKVMAFNLWQLPGIASPNTADKQARARAAEAVIRANDADVVVLDEAFSAQAEELRTRLKDVWPYQTPLVGQYCKTSPGWTTVNGNCSNSPVVVNGGVTVLSKATVTEQHQLVFGNSYQGTADYLSNKGAALARLVVNGKPLWITGTHLQADEGPETLPKAHDVRMAQLGEIRDLVTKYAPPTEPVVVAGDLNIEYWAGQARKDSLGRTQIQQGEAVLDGVLGTTGEGAYTFDAATNPNAAKSVPVTYRDSLDYVGTVRAGSRPLAAVGPVQLVHYDGGTIPSDHYPVVAKIQY
ncbi:sphingomyelin phosphodiesterase [Amycolatopsis regifaucium]|uniref:Phospholipase n=1 Tax=Amycolatopsis regifaucium TaxID=546365 RepID=A0A154MXM7_9PSEU|nr:sphingomyelin phosphodiesterase [Amycolatopsis regifaucium]KZB88209.1 phospholipase [Amycolatopsis regifaucium]OKA04289.1 phospholipase [Amycolatopsis regifaucium]SFH45802.1 Metal-dependent hydrolase, endonuclease/exonuclease/phosphatase family [Amycolatopsis regifaucium]